MTGGAPEVALRLGRRSCKGRVRVRVPDQPELRLERHRPLSSAPCGPQSPGGREGRGAETGRAGVQSPTLNPFKKGKEKGKKKKFNSNNSDEPR